MSGGTTESTEGAQRARRRRLIDCPSCGGPMVNHGAQSRGDGDIYDVLGCRECEIWCEHHAEYCRCQDCREGRDRLHVVDVADDLEDFGADYRDMST